MSVVCDICEFTYTAIDFKICPLCYIKYINEDCKLSDEFMQSAEKSYREEITKIEKMGLEVDEKESQTKKHRAEQLREFHKFVYYVTFLNCGLVMRSAYFSSLEKVEKAVEEMNKEKLVDVGVAITTLRSDAVSDYDLLKLDKMLI
jgi:hypothetical protein